MIPSNKLSGVGYSALELRRACISLVIKHRISAKRLLDIGGGTGEFTKVIANLSKAKDVFIVDVSEKALSIALKLGFKTLLIDVSAEKLPFQDETFDMVLAIEVIEHLINPDHCIKECRRVLKSGGILLLFTPNLAWWVNRLVMLFGYQPYYSEPSTEINVGKFYRRVQPYRTSGHIRLFTFKALSDFLRYYGFKVIDYIGSPGDHRSKAFRVLDRILSRRASLSADIVVLATKMAR